MKLCRYGARGVEKPGLIDSAGTLRDLSGEIADMTPATLAPHVLARLAALDPSALPPVSGSPRYGPPVAGTAKFMAIGLNYLDHAHETGATPPSEPLVFNKWVSCIQGADDPVMIPRDSVATDFEAELGVVIGTRAAYVEEADALRHVAGYCIVNDVSERDWQKNRGGTWDKGKGFATFGPVGPWLVTADEVGDPQALAVRLEIGGEAMQDGHTGQMIFSVAALIAYCSRFTVLQPGDIITTGTPAGVGAGRKPPRYLAPGDVITIAIDRLGQQRQEVIAFDAARLT